MFELGDDPTMQQAGVLNQKAGVGTANGQNGGGAPDFGGFSEIRSYWAVLGAFVLNECR